MSPVCLAGMLDGQLLALSWSDELQFAMRLLES